MSTRLGAILAIALGLLTLGGLAQANGRFPETLDLRFQRGGSGLIAGSATFGLLLSADQGESWKWVCEDAIGYRGIWDPQFVITAQGTIFGSTATGLRISPDGGCNWNLAPGALATAWISDLQEGPDGVVWVATANTAEGNDVYVSRDDGITFEPQGLMAAAPGAYWKSVRVAPGDPGRVYATGYTLAGDTPVPLLYRQDPEGWTAVPFSFGSESQLRLLGVSPVDPNLVFARINGDRMDTVLRSDDAGVSWTGGPEFPGDVSTFVAWPDGEVFLGSRYEGSLRSLDNGLTWTRNSERLTTPATNCGALAPNGEFWACGANWDPDRFAYGRSTDRGATWTKIMRFNEIMDPLDCPDGSSQDELCEAAFDSMVCATFNCEGVDAAPAPPDSGPRVDGGDPGANGGGGGCGCGVALAGLLVLPFQRRRRGAP